jgi:uncharacterized phage protein (TIGR02218 family)
MSYTEFETSIESGQPLAFFTFQLRDRYWRYTTAEVNQVVASEVYTSAAISASNIQQTGESVNDALTLECPSWIAPAQMFMSAPPTSTIYVTVSFKHVGSDQMAVGYTGEVKQVNFPFPGKARITCESLMSSMAREGLRLAWQRSCPYALYDPVTCKVDKAAFKIDFVVLSISGFTVGVLLDTTQDTDYFNGGFIEWLHPIRGIEYLAIDSHVEVPTPGTDQPNAILTLLGPPGELFEGATGSAYPGCDFTPPTCQDVFTNYPNYGGTPDMPGRSPFDGNPVF